jgi:biopolymer transport protein ExbD
VDAQGQYYWNEAPVAFADLGAQLSAEAVKQPQPELHIRGDKSVRYEHVVLAMSAARQAGLKKIGFVTDPVN